MAAKLVKSSDEATRDGSSGFSSIIMKPTVRTNTSEPLGPRAGSTTILGQESCTYASMARFSARTASGFESCEYRLKRHQLPTLPLVLPQRSS